MILRSKCELCNKTLSTALEEMQKLLTAEKARTADLEKQIPILPLS